MVVRHATRGFATKSQRLTIRCSQATFPISVLRNNCQDGSSEDYVEACIGRSTHPVGVRLARIGRGAAGRQPSWLSPVANVIHAPAIDRQHLGRDEAGIRLDQESHGGGNVLRRANPTDHGALAH